MPGLGPYSYLQRLLVGRPETSWRVQPFTINDNNPHTLVPAVSGQSHVITDVFLAGMADGRVVVDISGSGGVEVLRVQSQYEMAPLPGLKTPIVLPAGEAIICERISGAQQVTLTILGYTETVEVAQTVYTGT